LGGYYSNYNFPSQFVLDDESFRQRLKLNEWIQYIDHNYQNPEALTKIPPEYEQHPLIQEHLVEYRKSIALQESKKEAQQALDNAGIPYSLWDTLDQMDLPTHGSKIQQFIQSPEYQKYQDLYNFKDLEKEQTPIKGTIKVFPPDPYPVPASDNRRTVWASAFNDNVIIQF